MREHVKDWKDGDCHRDAYESRSFNPVNVPTIMCCVLGSASVTTVVPKWSNDIVQFMVERVVVGSPTRPNALESLSGQRPGPGWLGLQGDAETTWCGLGHNHTRSTLKEIPRCCNRRHN